MKGLCLFLALVSTLLFPFTGLALDPKAEALIAQGDAEVKAKHHEAALKLFLEAEKLAEDDVALLLRISREYSELVDEKESKEAALKSLDYAKRALALDPKNARAHLSVAVCYGKLTDFVGNKTKLEYSRILKEETEKSLALNPSDSFAWYVLGRWHYGVANVNGMLKMLARIVYGGLPPASNEEAIRCLKKATELGPRELSHHAALARAYTIAGKAEEAKKEWRIVLTLKPEDREEEADLAEARKALGK
jgi:tetratricopeptide (TPR) repeat protein